MKKVLSIVCAAACMAAVVVPAWSQSDLPKTASPLTTTLDLGYASQYVFRGIPVNEEGVVQPSLTVTNKYGLSFNFWGNMDTTDINGNSGDFNEVRYSASYAWKTDKGVALTSGLTRFTYPHSGWDPTTEVFLTAGLPGKLAPTVAFNYDFAEAKGLYATFGVGYKMPLGFFSKVPAVDLSAKVGYGTAGYNSYYFDVDKAALTDASVTAAFPIKVSNIMTLTPSASYSKVLDGTLKDSFAENPDTFYFGVTSSFSF